MRKLIPVRPLRLDELTDMTLPPGDPRLASAAEQELMRVPHDLPLTVNDSVLQYLSFFSTTKGHAVVEHGLDRSGRYNDMIRRVLKTRRSAAGPDVPGAGRIRISANRGLAKRAHAGCGSSCPSAAKNTIWTELTGSTSAATRKKPRAQQPVTCAICTICSATGTS